MIERLAILAPGLLGGSVARAARERSAARRIVLWARRPEARAALAQQPWCDEAAAAAADAVKGASLIVIAAPVDLIVPLTAEIAPHLAPGAIVTDVGSVKGIIAGPAAGAHAPTTAPPLSFSSAPASSLRWPAPIRSPPKPSPVSGQRSARTSSP